jgi:acetyl-CoA carboxylase carboxyltransferase component
MSWKPEVDEIEKRRAMAREMGGEEAVQKQHERGRLTVRERIAELSDPGSFHEHGPLAGHADRDENGELVDFSPANYVLGFARIDNRPVVIGGEDFTQRGGSPSPAGLRKSVYSEDLACRYRLPLVRFLEGGGGSVAGSASNASKKKGGTPPARTAPDAAFGAPRFLSIARILRIAPVCSAALGAVAGFPAARLAASHFSVMTRKTSQVLIGGPALVARALGQELTKDELGGAQVHVRSGVVDNVARDESDAIEQIRRFLSYMPTHVAELPPTLTPDDDPSRCEEALLEIIPRDRRKVYKMRKLLDLVVDRGSLFEMTAGYGRSQITALARMNGRPVGVLANDPAIYGGSMGAEGAQKVRRFVNLCETFHLPILSFIDEPGFMIGPASEAAATIRYGVDAIVAVVESTVPWISIHVRKAYGVAAAAHFGPYGTVLAWPSAESGALPLEGGVAVAFRREIAAADDPEAKRKELEEKLARGRSAFPRAELFGVHDLIDPRRTRPAVCEWLEWTRPLLEQPHLTGSA